MKSKYCGVANRLQLSLRCVEQLCYLEHYFINIITNEHSCILQQIVLCQCITHKSILHGVTVEYTVFTAKKILPSLATARLRNLQRKTLTAMN